MRRLDNLLGKAERYFIESFYYLSAKNIVFAYNHGYKNYLGINISEETFNYAKLTVSLWKKRKILDN
jgi:hypothetical protein